MADDKDGKTVKYCRRLDRTPEKEFEKLPDTEKKLISVMRGALENCRYRVDGIKEELAEKERTIEQERLKRKEAEERLKLFLVNPYKSPEVNSELRNRLPRSSKRDPLAEQNDSESAESLILDEVVFSSSKQTRNSPKSHISRNHVKRKVCHRLSFGSPLVTHTSKVQDDDMDSGSSTSDEDRHETEANHHGRGCVVRRNRSKGRHPSQFTYSSISSLSPSQSPFFPQTGASFPLVSPYCQSFSVTPLSSVTSFQSLPSPYHDCSPREGQATASKSRLSQSASFPLLNGHLGSDHATPGFKEVIKGQSASCSSLPNVGIPAAAGPDAPAQPLSQLAPSTDAAFAAAAAATVDSSATMPTSVLTYDLHSHSASSMSSQYCPLPAPMADSGVRSNKGGEAGVRTQLGPPPPFFDLPTWLSALPPETSEGLVVSEVLVRQTVQRLQEEVVQLKLANNELSQALACRLKETEVLKMQILAETPSHVLMDSDAARKFTDLMEEVKFTRKRYEGMVGERISQAEVARETILRDLETGRLTKTVDKRRGRHLTMSDLSQSDSESETESESDSENEEFGGKGPLANTSTKDQNPGHTLENTGDMMRVPLPKVILKDLELRHQRELQIYQEELQVIMDQRDRALDQLQEERAKFQVHQLRMPAQREQILMAKISLLQREKERAENLVKQLREERTERDLYFSLHKALFLDTSLNNSVKSVPSSNSNFNKQADSSRKNGGEYKDECENRAKKDNQLLEQLQQAKHNISVLQQRCQELEAKYRQESEDKNRLKRLNDVLRKKLISVSSVNVT